MTLREKLRYFVRRENGCLVWLGLRGKGVYSNGGRSAIRIGDEVMPAARAAWRTFRGRIPKGQQVLHKCDNPSCIRLSHLFIGTQLDNVADMVRKGRSAKGENHSQAKLTTVQVVEIRKRLAAGTARRWLASFYGVGIECIDKIARRDRWTHI